MQLFSIMYVWGKGGYVCLSIYSMEQILATMNEQSGLEQTIS